MGIMISTIRFAVDPSCIRGETAVIDDEKIVHQITHVLRLRVSDTLVLFDGTGYEYRTVIRSVNGSEITLSIIERLRGDREARMRITLYFSLLKGDKNDIVVQKCAELGVAAFVPVISARSVVTDLSASKRARMLAIAREAAELSGGVYVPEIRAAALFSDAAAIPGIIAYEEETTASLMQYRNAAELSLFIGPEGGYTEDEIALARGRNILPVTLGKRILRAETAAISACAALLL